MYSLKWVMRAVIVSGVCVSAHAGASGQARVEDAQVWQLPHDVAAIYVLFDSQRGTSLGEFCVLPCELASGVGANEPLDLAYRFLFRSTQGIRKAGEVNQVEEDAFNRSYGRSSAPLRMRGTYRTHASKPLKVGEVFRGLRGYKEIPKEPLDLILVEGVFEAIPYRAVDAGNVLEKKPVATLTTLAALRPSDGALLAGRYSWQGTLTRFHSFDAKPSRVATAVDLLLKGPPQKASLSEMKGRIDEAIKRGTSWLKGKQEANGRFADMASYWGISRTDTGSTALATMALIHGGMSGGDREVANALAYANQFKYAQAYSVAALLMAVEAKHFPLRTYEDLQTYDEEKAREQLKQAIHKKELELVLNAANWLVTSQLPTGGWGYDGADNLPNVSIVQYALLGLKSASRLGASIPPNVWRRAALYLLSGMQVDRQESSMRVTRLDGAEEDITARACAWGYYAGQEFQRWPETTSTMTLAALASLAICESELDRSNSFEAGFKKQVDDAIRGGTVMLGKHYSPRSSQPEGAWIGNAMYYYYLYSLERAGVFLNIRKFGEHDWFLEGASILLSEQKSDGRWETGFGIPIVDSSFALLYLKMATVPVRTPVATRGAKEQVPVGDSPRK